MRIDDWRLNGDMVTVPHAWGVETDLRWEGPAVYSASFIPNAKGWLVFHGVSAHARVFVDGALVCEHLGIWDAFSIPLNLSPGVPVEVVVEVTKNGGASFPVEILASGFLPYVFGTFGGIYRDVEWMESDEDPLTAREPCSLRAYFKGGHLVIDGQPTYLRGLLHWGWYPSLRHPNPDPDTCRNEISEISAMGFNCIKFCLWMPPHHYLEAMAAAGMFAWMELPIWNPSSEITQIKSEIERIVLQYRHHSSIVLWTVGCELGEKVSRENRKDLFDTVKNLTGGALVKDSSGGAEMYGGDPVEYGDFEDFHPYCDLSNYPSVLDMLQAGPRESQGVLLGECNDFDSIRDIQRIALERPFWASEDASLNAQGVRWQYDLPRIASEPTKISSRLIASSKSMKLFVHRMFQEFARSRHFAGSVITGIADTPISTSGFFDDWGDRKFEVDEIRRFMGPDTFFLIPQHHVPWIDGGNRVGLWDPWHVFDGPNVIRIGMHSEAGFRGEINWQISGDDFLISGTATADVPSLTPMQVAAIIWDAPANRRLTLRVADQEWPIETVLGPEGPMLPIAAPPTTLSAPAFREAAYDFRHPTLLDLFEGRWHTLLQVLPPLFCDPSCVPDGAEILAMRIDSRTHCELPLVVRVADRVWTTLRTGPDPAGVLVHRALLSL